MLTENAKEVICTRCTDTRHWAKAEDIYGDGALRHWLKYGDHEINRPCHESTDHGFTTPADKEDFMTFDALFAFLRIELNNAAHGRGMISSKMSNTLELPNGQVANIVLTLRGRSISIKIPSITGSPKPVVTVSTGAPAGVAAPSWNPVTQTLCSADIGKTNPIRFICGHGDFADPCKICQGSYHNAVFDRS